MNPTDDGPTDAEVAMARYAAARLAPGAPLRVEEFEDSAGRTRLDVAVFPDVPVAGLHTVATLSLHRHAAAVADPADPVELLTVLESPDVDLVAGLLAACCFALVAEGEPARAGTVLPDVAGDLLEVPVPHLVLTAPGSFPGLSRYRLADGVDVHWLQAVPLHETERRLLQERGLDALEDAFEAAGVDVADLWRNPVV
ncbi:suppressor of fused domain protein [Kineococcus gynurae]|uniref:Suppressor of fused domain protein n=1 Tax=Kineococcus gynurae TaxID=452979 RepID=A0ABV5LWL4_9ACTN